MIDSKLAAQFSTPQLLVRRINRQLDLVERLLAEAKAVVSLVPASITNSLGMQMIWCPPGTFLMGSPESEKSRCDDENEVRVRISQGFWIARTTVTQGQWQLLMGTSPSHFQGANLPVENVSWDDANAFNSILNDSENLPVGYRYDLPTEAQWEYACRVRDKCSYSGGNLDEVAWHYNNSFGQTHEVGQKNPNAWGPHDMHGNFYEWCSDWYEDTLKGGADPAGPSSGGGRVLRGGSWLYDASGCRTANRSWAPSGNRVRDLGFRPALVPSR